MYQNFYITGSYETFENRLHSNAITISDYNNFKIESGNYVARANYSDIWKWTREFEHIYYEISGYSTGSAPVISVTFDATNITFDSNIYTFDRI